MMKLHFAPKTYTPKDILEIEIFGDSYTDTTLHFCQQWLKGQEQFILHTSGSTGTPKPIKVFRKQMEASAKMTVEKLQLFSPLTALVCLNTNFVAGKMMLVRGMLYDWEMFVIEPTSVPFTEAEKSFQQNFFQQNYKDFYVDFVAMVPLQVQQTLIETPEKIATINKLKAMIIGGAAISTTLAQQINKNLSIPVYATYGMTETVSHVALQKVNNSNLEHNFFECLPNIQIKTDDRSCLNIKGEVTNHEWIQTNDIVTLCYNQEKQITGFQWIGRADNIINSGGVKIQIEEVEKQIEIVFDTAQIPKRFFVAGIADEKLGQKLVLVIEDKEWANEKQQKLLNSLNKTLTRYQLPKQIIFCDSFIETPTNKIDRKKIIEFW
jgi:O-succinylbenzoic acid--CoA ligase